jgi:hypothetical protein
MPTNHASAPIPLSQQLPSNPNHVRKDTIQAGPSSDSEPSNALPQIKVIEHPTLSKSKEKWQIVNRKRIRNMDEQEHPNAKKTGNNYLQHNGMETNEFNLNFTARQANTIHKYKDLKLKITNCNANIYFNRQCLTRDLSQTALTKSKSPTHHPPPSPP